MYHHGETAGFQLLQGRNQRRLILAGNLHAQDSGKLAAQPRHAALQPIPAVLCHQGSDGVHQAGPILADNGHYEQALHGPSPTLTVRFWQANPPLTASTVTLRGPAEAKVIHGESPMRDRKSTRL